MDVAACLYLGLVRRMEGKMRLIGMLMARNEDWCVGLSLRVLLEFCDAVVCLIHRSSDRTHDIVMELAKQTGNILVVADDKENWEEMRLRQAMLELARADGATHLWMGDADEILTGNLLPMPDPVGKLRAHKIPDPPRDFVKVRDHVQMIPKGAILQYPLYNLRGGLAKYHANGIWGSRYVSVAFADDPQLGWRGSTFHSREPQRLGVSQPALKSFTPVQQGAGGIMHLWGASERRLVAKHRAYRIAEALQWQQKPRQQIEEMYSMATDGRPRFGEVPANWTYSAVPAAWWEPYAKWDDHIIVDAEPWQEKWCDEMIALHGRERFAGLRV